ncbi:hypothetical protein SNE40_007299 [Patella caerulea]|uniref:Uncharacterized protein n=1 Tax=Patella caerulea TaxID=87958 RepID=A0AAN8JXN0_PATCE
MLQLSWLVGFLAVLCQGQGIWNRFSFSPNPNVQPTQVPRTQPPNLASIWGQSARQPFAQFSQMSMPGQMPNQALPNQGMPNPAMPNPAMPNPAMPIPGMPRSGMPNRGMPSPGMPKLWLPNSGLTDQATGPNQMPGAGVQRLGMPSPGMTNQAMMNLRMQSQGNPTMAGCVPTFYQPQLCTVNGENQHKYTLQAVMRMLRDKNIEKVPECIRGIQKINCGDYNAAQTIWKKGYCYCKRYHNNLSRYAGMPPLRCVLNACGACTQEFYIGRNRFVDCD